MLSSLLIYSPSLQSASFHPHLLSLYSLLDTNQSNYRTLCSNLMGKTFKDNFSFEERLEESRDIIAKYPLRVPVIVERYSKTELPELEKKKYLVPRDMSVGQFVHILSNRLHLTPQKALFVFVQNTLPQTTALMDTVYESLKDEDGFLYMCYSSEKTFGYSIVVM